MITTVVFDAYGTLFDVAAAARAAASEPGGEALRDVWPDLAARWRDKQLQYTWLRAVSGDHLPFDRVTADGLDWAIEATGADPALRPRLLALYDRLGAYPEVPGTLAALKEAGKATAILSNGTPGMLDGAVESAGIGPLLDATLSVEGLAAPIYKPHPSVYAMVGERFGAAPDEVLFVSSNGWDVTHAAAFGFRTAWANRAGEPADRVGRAPDHVIADLTPVPDLAR
ncbi:MAG: haloacid dehalogenase type II [Hasllibacter sp.]